jgi:hypothetical protein
MWGTNAIKSFKSINDTLEWQQHKRVRIYLTLPNVPLRYKNVVHSIDAMEFYLKSWKLLNWSRKPQLSRTSITLFMIHNWILSWATSSHHPRTLLLEDSF